MKPMNTKGMKKIRNYLRGSIAITEQYEVRKILAKVKKECTPVEHKTFVEFLRGDALFKNVPLSKNFMSGFTGVVAEDVDYKLGDILKKINNNESKILIVMQSYIELVHCILKFDFEKCLEIGVAIKNKNGVSLCLLRMFYFIRYYLDQMEEMECLLSKVDGFIRDLTVVSIGYVDDVIKELINPRVDYFNVVKTIEASDKAGFKYYIASDFVSSLFRSEEEFMEKLKSYHSVSLIDAYIYLMSMGRLKVGFIDSAIEKINKPLVSAFKTLSELEVDFEKYMIEDEDKRDLDFFRICFLFIENNVAWNYKLVHSSLYCMNNSVMPQRFSFEFDCIEKYFKDVGSLRDISVGNNGGLSWGKYCRKKSGCLENSSALLYLLERNDGQLKDEAEDFMRLMSSTSEIGVITPRSYLERLLSSTENKELKIVIYCLMLIKEDNQIVDYDLRELLQEVVRENYESNVLSLVKKVRSVSESVSDHLVQMLDEIFLNKLYDLVDIPNKALEERAKILEWYGEVNNSSEIRERAKNIRVDIQINKEKGYIDDSRIYVDPNKMIHWVNDNIIKDFTLLLESEADLNILTHDINWNSLKGSFSLYDQIGILILQVYREFCENNLFGIASYLGRRIRHGTLRGTALKGYDEIRNDIRYETLFEDKSFLHCYEQYMADYSSILRDLINDKIHIKNKRKPKGLISYSLDSANKKSIASYMMVEIISSYAKIGSAMKAPYIMLDYCWRLIKDDLESVKKELMLSKKELGLFSFDSNGTFYGKQRNLIKELCKEMNANTEERFRIMTSWFSKPSFVSPTAELKMLFKAVIAEVKEINTDFDPEVNIETSESILIEGGTYFVIYDSLYVVIMNAAKYGNSSGVLNFRPKLKGDGLIYIEIESEIKEQDDVGFIEKRIKKFLDKSCEDAHVVEGESGISKLRRLEQEGHINGLDYQFPEGRVLTSFNYVLEHTL